MDNNNCKKNLTADFFALGLPALINRLRNELYVILETSSLPDINCESTATLLKKCVEALELARLNYEYICNRAIADKVEGAISSCPSCAVIEVNEINATALKLAIDFDCPGGVCLDKILTTAQKFKDFLEK